MSKKGQKTPNGILQSLVLDYSAPVKASQVFVLLAQKIGNMILEKEEKNKVPEQKPIPDKSKD